jgi:hypothetical protein
MGLSGERNLFKLKEAHCIKDQKIKIFEQLTSLKIGIFIN